MADPMTQSHLISSSQGLNDGHSKDSKSSDSFFSSSPVSIIQSPQDKSMVLDSDKPSEGVTTSLRFSSQPSSFSPVTYGNESSCTPSGNKSRSFQEKLELFESSLASQKQDSSPVKVSPVSERIKALEALAAKKNDSDWSDGGFPHFKERHYEKSPTEAHGISNRSSVKKKPTPTEQDSPESPFEILDDTRRGSDFEDTADWMRAHLPPAPNFNIDEADFDEVKPSSVIHESPCKEAKSKDTETTSIPDIPESFVGVPDEFMDTPTEVNSQINDDPIPSKQDSVEDESEFDLRFLPTAYMWDKQQEKVEMNAQEQPDLSKTQEIVASPAVPAGFESPSLPSPIPVPLVDLNAKEQTDTLGGSKEPVEVLEVDSSGESDDTVIEDVNGLGHAVGTDTLECKPSTNNETLSHEQVKPVIQVPIINVIETEEQNFSDYEVEHEEELEEEQYKNDDEQEYQIKQEPTREASQSPEEQSGPLKSMFQEVSPTTEDISSLSSFRDSDSPEDKLIKANASEHTFCETSLDRPSSEDLQAQSVESLDEAETFIEYALDAVETDETAEITQDLPPKYDDLLNESSDIDTYLDHYTNEKLALHDQLNSDVFTEIDSEAGELLIGASHQHSQNSTIFTQQSYEETVVDEVDESLQESKRSCNTLPETSPPAVSADADREHLTSQNNTENLETVDKIAVVEDQKAIEASSNFSLMEQEDHVTQPAPMLSSIQEGTPAPLSSFHNDLSSEITEEIIDFDVNKQMVENNSEQGGTVHCDASDRKESPELVSKPEITETEPPAAEATDSFVEFMRECLKLQQDEESKGSGQPKKEPISVAPSPPAIVMDLVQEEDLTISALRELESSKEQDNETNICNKNTSVSSKDESSRRSSKSESIGSLPTAQYLPNEYQSEASLTREVEAIDMLVAEAYHLAEHVLAVILTHLSVHDLVYWRDPKKSGIVFGTSLLLLLSLAAFSVISIISYLLLALLCVTISFRVYKSVIQAVQKTNEGHPFKELMEKDVSLPPETFRKNVDVCLTYINRGLKQLSRLFLVEDLVDSLKLAVVMWLLTYVGAVFNGITVLILVDILAFTVPPLYEKYKTQIDHYIGIAHNHIKNVVTKIQEKLPKAAKRNKTE